MPIGRRFAEAFGATKTVDPKFDAMENNISNFEKKIAGFEKVGGGRRLGLVWGRG